MDHQYDSLGEIVGFVDGEDAATEVALAIDDYLCTVSGDGSDIG